MEQTIFFIIFFNKPNLQWSWNAVFIRKLERQEEITDQERETRQQKEERKTMEREYRKKEKEKRALMKKELKYMKKKYAEILKEHNKTHKENEYFRLVHVKKKKNIYLFK